MISKAEAKAFLKDFAKGIGKRINSQAAAALLSTFEIDRLRFLNFQQFASLVNEVVKRPELLWQVESPVVHIRASSPPEAAYSVPAYANVEEAWPLIQQAIQKLLTQQSLPQKDWIEAYDAIYKLCADRKYRELYSALREHFHHHCVAVCDSLVEYRNDSLLMHYRTAWMRFMEGVPYVLKIFHYLRRFYVPKYQRTEGLQDIPALAAGIWRDRILSKIQEHLWMAIAGTIQRERCGEQRGSNSELRDVIESYIRVGEEQQHPEPLYLYQDALEFPFLRLTRDHYATLSVQYLQENGSSAYMKKVCVSVS